MSHFFPISDPVVIFAVVTILILLAPIVLGRWKLPGMIGLLLAGAVLGPNAAGVLARDQSFILLGAVGLLYIMFTAALELDVAAFKRYKFHGIVFGALTFIFPQAFGTLFGKYALGFGWPAAILMGSVLASHTLLSYPIVSRLGIAKSKVVTTSVGATMITDVAALLVLAVIAGAARGEMNEAFWYRLGLMMALYVGGIMIGLPRLGRWFFRKVRPDGAAEFVFVLAAVFTAAALSHVAGVEPIVGAFLAGLALNRLIPHNSPLMNRIQFTGEAIFVPFFLLSVGMLLDVRVFAGGLRAWLIAIGMTVAVIAGKFIAAEATRIFLRFNKDEARLSFGLTIPQAAATLATTMVGFEIHLFDEAVVNGSILTILVTCIIGPWFANKHGRILAVAANTDQNAAVETSQRVLVPLASAEDAESLIASALLLRGAGKTEPIYPLSVIPDGDRAEEQMATAEKMLARSVMHLAAADVPAQPLTRIDVNVSAGILRTRRELRATHVVVAWGAGEAERLTDDAEFTLLRCRLPQPINTTSRVIFICPPNAELERSFAPAAGAVKTIAHKLGARLTAVVERDAKSRVLSRMSAAQPTHECDTYALESWSSLTQGLADQLKEGDLIVLYAPRPGSIGWQSADARLPERLAARFSSANLIVVNPAEAKELGATPAAQLNPLELPREKRTVLGLDAASMERVTTALVDLARGELGEKLEAPAPQLHERALEVAPGAVGLHVEAEVLMPLLFVATTRAPVEVSGASGPAQLTFLVVQPRGEPSDAAFRLLSPLARALRSPGALAELSAATDFEAFSAALRRASSGTAGAPKAEVSKDAAA